MDHYVNSRFLLPSASPNQHSIELQNLQSYGTYIIYDNNKRVGVFGNNDSHLEKQSKMIWNVDEGYHRIEAKLAARSTCFLFDSDCFDQKEVLEELNPRFRAAAVDIYIEGRPSVTKYIITLDQEVFSDPKLSLAH